jgi:hypothetical protein
MTPSDSDDRRHRGVSAGERPVADEGPVWGLPTEDAPAATPLVLELVIAGTEPLTGTIRPADGKCPIAFHGWIDLMGALSSLGARSGIVRQQSLASLKIGEVADTRPRLQRVTLA